jgi:hypothetical protein
VKRIARVSSKGSRRSVVVRLYARERTYERRITKKFPPTIEVIFYEVGLNSFFIICLGR